LVLIILFVDKIFEAVRSVNSTSSLSILKEALENGKASKIENRKEQGSNNPGEK